MPIAAAAPPRIRILRVLAAPSASAGVAADGGTARALARAVVRIRFVIALPFYPARARSNVHRADSSSHCRKRSCPAGCFFYRFLVGRGTVRLLDARCRPYEPERSVVCRPRIAGAADSAAEERVLQIESLIRAIPNFPIPGILFRDITPLLKDREGFKAAVDLFIDKYKRAEIDYVVAIEARGYMLGAPLAYSIGAGFVPVRKPGKLPGTKFTEEYALEYGTNSLEINDDAIGRGQRVLVVDDLLATGGTAAATARLLERLGADVDAFALLVELTQLRGREGRGAAEIVSFVAY